MTQAFPTDEYMNEQRVGQHEGMELRDFLAAHVVSGYHASLSTYGDDYPWPTPEDIASYAYEVADAMVKARKKRRAKA